MSRLFEVRNIDHQFYQDRLKGFLPDKIIDFHTHVWLDKFRNENDDSPTRSVSWPSLVANDNSIEDLIETYRLMFPDKTVTPVIFGIPDRKFDINKSNEYIRICSRKTGFPSLLLTMPGFSGGQFEEELLNGGYKGCKVYLNYADIHIPEKEIKIFDFLPLHQLEVLNRHSLIALVHIPRDGRLKDPENLQQMIEIERSYPNVKLIIAHVGRAYCIEDIGNAFEVLSATKNMMFDFSANTNQYVFTELIKTVGPKRIVFGSDLPILRMRMKRVCENGNYVNLVPRGIYGNISGDPHMRVLEGEEAEKLTFFMYEEIKSFRLAAEAIGLNNRDIEDIFYNNAAKILGI